MIEREEWRNEKWKNVSTWQLVTRQITTMLLENEKLMLGLKKLISKNESQIMVILWWKRSKKVREGDEVMSNERFGEWLCQLSTRVVKGDRTILERARRMQSVYTFAYLCLTSCKRIDRSSMFQLVQCTSSKTRKEWSKKCKWRGVVMGAIRWGHLLIYRSSLFSAHTAAAGGGDMTTTDWLTINWGSCCWCLMWMMLRLLWLLLLPLQ